MIHGISRLVAPTEEPITLAEAKAHLRVEHNADDVLITALIVAARQAAESHTGRALVSQQWRLTLEDWQDSIELPNPPLISVEAITYLDSLAVRQTLASSVYQVITDTLVGSVQLAYDGAWPAIRAIPGSIRVDYTAGYGIASAVPQAIKVWMLIAHRHMVQPARGNRHRQHRRRNLARLMGWFARYIPHPVAMIATDCN